MLVVSDTTAITNLHQVKLLLLMKQLYGQVVVPKAVFEELCEIPSQKEILRKSNWIRVEAIQDTELYATLRKRIDHGEAEAIVLAKELSSDILVMDELAGRRIAQSFGIKIIGLLGILILAKKSS